MIALIAGEGALPGLLLARLRTGGEAVRLAALAGHPPDLPGGPVETLRIERLGSYLDDLVAGGVSRVCMAGRVRRPEIDPAAVDAATAPLLDRLARAMALGDDGTLRAIVSLFEERGIAVVGAQDIAPDLLAVPGVPTRRAPEDRHAADAALGAAEVAEMGRADSGQACVIRDGAVIAREGPEGTDAMLAGVTGRGGLLFKAPKPAQDRRVDLPTIGPDTARAAAAAGLDGIAVAAGGVLVLEREAVVAACDAARLFLWGWSEGAA